MPHRNKSEGYSREVAIVRDMRASTGGTAPLPSAVAKYHDKIVLILVGLEKYNTPTKV